MKAPVCAVIPTWQGADVIADAIGCMQAQSFADLEILVSVDASSDGTAGIARRAAQADHRLRVLEHQQRVGWVRNVNAALEEVRSEFYFLYFHDDLIEPSFVATLLAHLEAEPQANAVFCSTIQDHGSHRSEDYGRAYTGSPLERMLDRLLLDRAGAPLRALTRRRALDAGLRFPVGSFYGFHAQHAYLLDLIGGADCLYEPAPLYTRRNWREGALTRSWREQPREAMAADLALTARHMHAIGDARLSSTEERDLLRRAVGLRLGLVMRQFEARNPGAPLIALESFFGGAGDSVAFPDRWAGAATAVAAQIAQRESQATGQATS